MTTQFLTETSSFLLLSRNFDKVTDLFSPRKLCSPPVSVSSVFAQWLPSEYLWVIEFIERNPLSTGRIILPLTLCGVFCLL